MSFFLTHRRHFAARSICAASVFVFVLGLAATCGLCRTAWCDEDDLLTVPELLVPKRGQDLSAFRFDSDVFGWNKTYTQVGALVLEVNRGPKGMHRGEVFMAAYPVGEAIPIHNVQLHVITHAAFPDDPVPLSDVRDMYWSLENPMMLGKWPVRPKRKALKGFMHVVPIWDPMDPNSAAQSVRGPATFETAAEPTDQALCRPGVGFILRYKGRTRVVPHIAIDLQVSCALLKMTDSRIYWAHPSLAAGMVRFDFSPTLANEQSARFVVSASWLQAEAVHFVASASRPIGAAMRQRIAGATQSLGPLRFVVEGKAQAGAAQEALVAVTAAPKFLPLARRVARSLNAGAIDIAADDNAQATLTLYFGRPKSLVAAPEGPKLSPKTGPGAAPPGFLEPGAHPVFGTQVPQRMLDSPVPDSSTLPPRDPPRPSPTMSEKTKSYLDDWRVP